MFRTAYSLSLVIAALGLTACADEQARGFSLPEGDPARGQQVFASHGCVSCHDIKGLEVIREGITPDMSITIGGEVTRVDTYGALVTAVINPSHRLSPRFPASEVSTEDGQSLMPSVNEELTVAELIDLVAFLQDQYELVPYEPTYYPPYHYIP